MGGYEVQCREDDCCRGSKMDDGKVALLLLVKHCSSLNEHRASLLHLESFPVPRSGKSKIIMEHILVFLMKFINNTTSSRSSF